jgi:hypothetical protein
MGGDPRTFHPNSDGWTDTQKKNHEEDCKRWNEQELDPSEPWYLSETDPYRYGPGVQIIPTTESMVSTKLLTASEWELLVNDPSEKIVPAT